MSKKIETVVYKGKKYSKYTVDSNGKVVNTETNKELKPFDDDRGYDCVDLMDNSGSKCRAKVHLIVAHTFLGSQGNKIVEHKDANKKNNKLTNLEYTTQKENVKRAQVKVKKKVYLTESMKKKIKELKKKDKTLEEIADIIKVETHVVRDFLQGKTYN